jgi:PKD repeat protein
VYAVSANPNDGSCWAVDAGRTSPTPQAVHLSADGTELWRGGDFVLLWSVSVNPSDDSCWVADDSGVAHFAADGTQRWRGRNFHWAESVSVNSADGSCWVADTGNGQVVHLVPGPPKASFTASPTGGTAPLTVQFTDTSSGNPTSWAWSFGDGATATAQHPAHQYAQVGTYDVTLTVTGGTGSGGLAKPRFILVTFTDVPVAPEPYWALHQILACVDTGIVQGYADGTYGPALPVDRASMAVYISRALAGGNEAVPEPSVATPTFSDVDTSHWAYKYIEYAASPAANVVQGYSDGTYKPDALVNRGQMAVYVARAMVSPTGDAAVPDPPAAPTFTDVSAEGDWGWCYRQVEYCVAVGVVQGYSDGTYHPESAVTRDQMAVYIQRAFELPM